MAGGAYGDMVATFGLDDRMFERGMRGVERKAARGGSRVSDALGRSGRDAERKFTRSFTGMERSVVRFGRVFAGALGVGSAVGIASRGIAEYAKVSDSAAASLGRLGKAQTSFMQSLGRDLTQSGLVDDLAMSIGMIESGYSWFSDRLTRLAGGDPTGLREAAALDESVTKSGRARAGFEAFRRSGDLAASEAWGDVEISSTLRQSQAELEAVEAAKKIGLSGAWLDEVRSMAGLPEQIGRKQRARDRELDTLGINEGIKFTRRESTARMYRDDDEMARIGAERTYRERTIANNKDRSIDTPMRALRARQYAVEYKAALEGINQEEERRKRLADETLGFERRGLEIDVLRAQHKESQADSAQVMLEYDQRIAQVMDRTDISTTERARYIRAAADARDARLNAGATGGARELSIGLGARVQGQVLGTGGSGGAAGPKDIVAELKRANQNLRKIEAKVGTWA